MSGVRANAYRDNQWKAEIINKKISALLEKKWKTVEGAYGPDQTEELFNVLNRYKETIKNKNILVVGSETPWVESIMLAIGANHVTTLEYNKIKTTHPKVLI